MFFLKEKTMIDANAPPAVKLTQNTQKAIKEIQRGPK